MEHREVLARMLDYVENVLADAEREALAKHLEQCGECRDTFNQYRGIVALEKKAAAVPAGLSEDLSAGVMAGIARLERTEHVTDEMRYRTRCIVGGLVSTNLVLLGILALLAFNTLSGRPGALLGALAGFEAPAAVQPQAGMIPAAYYPGQQPAEAALVYGDQGRPPGSYPGFKQVTLNLVSTKGLEELLRPDALVDVKISYREGQESREAVVAQLVRVLAVNFVNPSASFHAGGKETTVTLLIPDGDAQRVERVRLVGDLTLSVITGPDRGRRSEKVTLYDPSGRPVTDDLSPDALAVMYISDPKTGLQTKRVFEKGRWRDEKGLELTAF